MQRRFSSDWSLHGERATALRRKLSTQIARFRVSIPLAGENAVLNSEAQRRQVSRTKAPCRLAMHTMEEEQSLYLGTKESEHGNADVGLRGATTDPVEVTTPHGTLKSNGVFQVRP